MLFKSDDFTYDQNDITQSAWRSDFEARFPNDTWGVMGVEEFNKLIPNTEYWPPEQQILQLKTLISWVKSTDRTTATNNLFSSPITLRDRELVHNNGYQEVFTNKTFERDTAEYRLTKFRAELSQYVELESAIFYYIFT